MPPYLDDGLADDLVDRCRSSSLNAAVQSAGTPLARWYLPVVCDIGVWAWSVQESQARACIGLVRRITERTQQEEWARQPNDRQERALCPSLREALALPARRIRACARALLRCQSRWRPLH